jgi:hypothetical protein
MKDDVERLIYTDYILIGKDFSWSILFSHEDGMLIDGPFYFNKEKSPNKGIQRIAPKPGAC